MHELWLREALKELLRKRYFSREDFGLEEERSTKQATVYTESTLRSEMFDMVLLCNRNKCKPHSSTPHEALQNETSSNL